MVIMALVGGAALTLLMAQVDSQRQATTRVRQDAIRIALTNFISRNSRLPCPADPTLAPGSANYGVEAATPGTCTGITSNGTAPGTVVTGLVPWVSLGLAADAVTDGFFNQISYQVVLSATNLKPESVAGMRGFITLHSSGPGVLGAPTTGNQINDCSGGVATNPCAAVVALVSHGKNGYGAYLSGGARSSTAGTGADEQANADNDSRFVRKDFSDASANPFDDIVVALTPNDLLTPLTQNGSIKDAKATLSASFEVFRGAIVAYAVANRAGAPGAYLYNLPPSIASISLPPAAKLDPWGNAINYTPWIIVVSASPSANLAYTLSSNGPDGVVGGGDDISVNVSIADLQNTFSKVGF